jgi:hypothetical protein
MNVKIELIKIVKKLDFPIFYRCFFKKFQFIITFTIIDGLNYKLFIKFLPY